MADYKKLDTAKHEIRLLYVETNSPEHQPRCEITVASLQTEIDFCALSYVWGDPIDRRDILLSGKPLSVTANLDVALRYLQCVQGLSRIWIDALCINQNDAQEKSEQIGYLPEIYARAQKTYMWVGPPVYYSDVAISSIREIQSIPWQSWGNARIFSIRQLLERPYWSRIWIIQEAFYSRHAVVKCGHDEVNFDMFYDLVRFVEFNRSLGATAECPENPNQNLIKLGKFPFQLLFRLCPRDRPKDSRIRIDLFRWLNYCDGFASTLCRDRIFALLNLSFVMDNNNVRIDYTADKSDRRVFSELTAYIMRSRSSTQYLLPFQVGQVGKILDLPSWVPDWTARAYSDRIITGPGEVANSAGQSESAWERICPDKKPLAYGIRGGPIQFKFSDDYENLYIRGAKVDKLSYAVRTTDVERRIRTDDFWRRLVVLARGEILAACESWELRAQANPKNAYGSSEGLSEALWRTMLGNRIRSPTGDHFVPGLEFGAQSVEWKAAVAAGVHPLPDNLQTFESRITSLCEVRAFCCTEKGRVGLVPSEAQEGDEVYVFEDGRVPFVLRRSGDHHQWLGEAYIHGIMYGEGLQEAQPADVAMLKVR